MKRPEFFIVGAPKCGTTFLTHHLSRHPEVFMPNRKELHYFGSDLTFATRRISYDDYAAHFRGAERSQVPGEASVWYLYSTHAAEEIKEYRADARIIIMLRNPVDMMWSLHQQLLYTLDEDIRQFAEALAAEPDRAKGQRLPKTTRFPAGLLYSQVARYAPQVSRYKRHFGPDQLCILLFDDLQQDPNQPLKCSFEFLGVSDRGNEPLRPVNPASTSRSRALQSVLFHPPRFVSGLGRLLPSRLRHEIVRAGARLNTRPAIQRVPFALRREIGPSFEDDVHRLEDLISRDLSGWVRSWIRESG